MALVAALLTALTLIFWRPLKISTFDPGFADTIGIRTGALGIGLVIAAAIAAVAAFDAVGSIIVIAMFICPPAAARLMTDRLEVQVLWSVAFATVSAVAGYVLAGYGPLWIGAENAVSAAGMIATVSGADPRRRLPFRPPPHPQRRPARGRRIATVRAAIRHGTSVGFDVRRKYGISLPRENSQSQGVAQ